MGGMVFFFMVSLAFGALGSLALTLGVDSRPEFDDPRAAAGSLTS